MAQMTSKERFQRIFDHKEADRIPINAVPWNATIERWQREGMPKEANWAEYFDLDCIARIGADNSPRFEKQILEETEDYKIFKTEWGATLKDFKHTATAPEFIDFAFKDPDTWAEAKSRMTPSRDRINWKYLEANYKNWRENGHWIVAKFWFGFDVTHSWMVGTERLLMALVEQPEWCVDMWNTQLDLHLALFDMIWDAGYEFDCIKWPDDMGYKQNQFFSVGMYRELLKPVHKRAIDWAHAKGIKAHMHSCGDVNPFVPELIELGLDALHPLEVKAGMDPIHLKQTYGKDLVFNGGISALLWDKPDEIKAALEEILPVMKESGGYIFSSDHSVPSSVSLENFRRIIGWAKEFGAY